MKRDRPIDSWGIERTPLMLVQRTMAEMFGTFALTFVSAGASVIGALSGQVSDEARAIASGLTVMAMIYSFGAVSGAHINPAVTFAFALRRVFPWRDVPLFWSMQILGAVLAAIILRSLFGVADHVGATSPHASTAQALVMETLLTLLLVSVILSTATRLKVVGPNAAIAVGGTVILCGLFAQPVTGASMNPARSFGPALIANTLSDYWIYVAGPMLGATLAVVVIAIIHGGRTDSETEAAQGKNAKS